MSCRNIEMPNGRIRQFDVTAAAVMAEGRRVAESRRVAEVPIQIADAVESTVAPAPSRSQEICISVSILVTIVGVLGLVVVFFD